jgi:hypothetical protein
VAVWLLLPLTPAAAQPAATERAQQAQAVAHALDQRIERAFTSGQANDIAKALKALDRLRLLVETPPEGTLSALGSRPEIIARVTAAASTNPDQVKAALDQIVSDVFTNASTPWCEDALTLCRTTQQRFLNGLRFVAEPRLGNIIQTGSNRIDSGAFDGFSMIGLETDLRGNSLGLQLSLVLPGRVKLDPRSRLVTEKRLMDSKGVVGANEVGVNYGLGVGITLLNGILSIGYLRTHFDELDFVGGVKKASGESHKDSVFVNLQPVAALRAAVAARKSP